MSEDFLTYYSIIELALDFENALDIAPSKITGLWYYFKITDYIYQTTCPILILIQTEENKKDMLFLNIEEIVETLGYIPEIKLQNKDLQECLSHNGQIGSFDINTKLGFSYISTKHYPYITSFIDYFKNKDNKITLPEQIKTFNCIGYENITFVNSKAAALAKIFSNEIESENTILQIKTNEIADTWIGIFWVYKKEKEFPPEEAVAYVRECDKCGKNFIANWAKEITTCENCLNN